MTTIHAVMKSRTIPLLCLVGALLLNVSSSTNYKDEPINCKEIQTLFGQTTDGIYRVYPDLINPDMPLLVYCDLTTDGGGWTVIQRRQQQAIQQDFYLPWTDYVKGFGDLSLEFWLGLDNIHALTNQGNTEVRIDLQDVLDNKAYSQYWLFSVGDAASNYKLSVIGYLGTAGNSLEYNSGMAFSTHDSDNDQFSANCAATNYRYGAWWYNDCTYANLNGFYYGDGLDHSGGINWVDWKGFEALKASTIMVRPSTLRTLSNGGDQH